MTNGEFLMTNQTANPNAESPEALEETAGGLH
jgi:hypothetical protein